MNLLIINSGEARCKIILNPSGVVLFFFLQFLSKKRKNLRSETKQNVHDHVVK